MGSSAERIEANVITPLTHPGQLEPSDVAPRAPAALRPRWGRGCVGRAAVSLAVVLGLATAASELRAESAAWPCIDADVVEVFPGAAGCPDAQYVVINVSDAEVEAGVGFWDDVYVFDRCYRFLDLISLSPPKWDGGASGVIVVGTTALQQLTGIEPDIVVDSLGLDPYGGTVSDCGSVLRYEMSDIEPGQAVARDPVTDTLSSVAPVARNGSGASQPFSCGPMSEAGADGGKLDASADASATSPPPCPSIQPPPPPPNNEAGPTPSETEAGAGGSGASFTSGGAAGSLPSGGSPASGGSAVSGGSAASGTSATPDGSAQASNLNGVPGEAGDPGGCGCTVPGRKRGGGYGLAAALVGLVVVTARRRVRLEPLRRFP